MSSSSSSNGERLTYLIVGATGKQGGACLDALLEDETPKTLRFLSRKATSPASVKLLERAVNVYEGSLLDPASLENALYHVDRAFLVTQPMDGVDKEVKQGKTFIDAAKKCGVKHIVFTSVCAADTATSVPHFQSKWEIEKYLEASGIPFTILRPVAFMDNFSLTNRIFRFLALGGLYAMSGWKTLSLIAVEDIGFVGARALLNPDLPEFKNKRIDLSAGEYDIHQTLDGFEQAWGSRPWYAWFFPPQLVYLLPYDFKMMMFYFRDQGYPPVDIEALKRIHPGLLSVRDWAAKGSKIKTD